MDVLIRCPLEGFKGSKGWVDGSFLAGSFALFLLLSTLSLYILVCFLGLLVPMYLFTTFSDECLGLNTDEGRSEV